MLLFAIVSRVIRSESSSTYSLKLKPLETKPATCNLFQIPSALLSDSLAVSRFSSNVEGEKRTFLKQF